MLNVWLSLLWLFFVILPQAVHFDYQDYKLVNAGMYINNLLDGQVRTFFSVVSTVLHIYIYIYIFWPFKGLNFS